MNLVASKQRFLEWIEKQIKDDEIVVITNVLAGNLSASKKRNTKFAGFTFAADAFARPGDVGHIALRKTPAIALCICPPEFIADKAKQLIEEAEQPKDFQLQG